MTHNAAFVTDNDAERRCTFYHPRVTDPQTTHTKDSAAIKPRGIGWRMVLVLAELHALTFSLAFPPLNLWPLIFLTVVPLAILAARTDTPWRHAAMVLGITIMQWLWICRWSLPVTAAGYPAFALIMALYAPLFVVLLAKLCRPGGLFARWPLAILAAIVWGGVEFLRGRIAFDGYPWFLIAHPTIEWGIFPQIASLVGGYGVGIIMAIMAGAIADVCVRSRLTMLGRLGSALLGVGVCVGTIWFGYATIGDSRGDQGSGGDAASESAADLNILVIQTNLPQDNKIGWPVEQQETDIPAFIELTRAAIADARDSGIEHIDLIVWPETMVPGAGFEQDTKEKIAWFGDAFAYLYRWSDAIRGLTNEFQTPMLVGSAAWVGASIQRDGADALLDKGNEYNSAYLIQPGDVPTQRYDKVFLTPFGETMPYISQSPWLEQKLLSLGAGGMTFNLDAADGPRLLELPTSRGPVHVATPICFEDTVPWLVREMANLSVDPARTVIINLSNDGWFGTFDEGRAQHVQIARMRCIEHRLPMVRAANTGLSVHVDSQGKLVDVVGAGRYGTARRDGWMVARVRFDGRRTLYTKLGDLPGWLAFGLTPGLLFVGWLARRRQGPVMTGPDDDA